MRDYKFLEATIQAGQKVRENPYDRFVQARESRKMNSDLAIEGAVVA